MFSMSGPSEIMLSDETLLLRRQISSLGDSVIIVDGKRVYRDFVEFQIDCNVQPTTGDDLLLLPEGDRFDEQLILYVQDTSEQPQPNDLVKRGDWYVVQAAEGWGSYTRVRMQRVDVGPDRAVQG